MSVELKNDYFASDESAIDVMNRYSTFIASPNMDLFLQIVIVPALD